MAPTSYKCEISTPIDGTLSRDRMVVTPHLSDGGTPFNAQQVVDAVVANMKTYLKTTTGQEIRVRLYRDGAPKPNYPVAFAIANDGTATSSTAPRELSLCLSFYSAYNRPRWRGRIYIPYRWQAMHTVGGQAAARPSSLQMDSVLAFATEVLKPLKTTVGANWTVWSTADGTMKDVTNYYVDDEWDIQRRRGRAPTTRTTGSVP